MPVVFEHDFEDNSLAAWTDTGLVAPTIVTNPIYEGARALRSNTVAQNVRLRKALTADSTMAAKFAVRRTAAADEYAILFDLSLADDTKSVLVQNLTNIALRTGDGGVFTTIATGPVMTQNQWFLVDLKVDASANPWQLNWKVDGVEQTGGTAALAATSFDRVSIGTWGFNMTFEAHHDLVKVSDEFAYITAAAGPPLSTPVRSGLRW